METTTLPTDLDRINLALVELKDAIACQRAIDQGSKFAMARRDQAVKDAIDILQGVVGLTIDGVKL